MQVPGGPFLFEVPGALRVFMAVVLSAPPEKKSPWSKYYAERGVTRPPLAEGARPLFQRGPQPGRRPAAAAASKAPAVLSAELTAAIAAVTAEVGTTAAPFLTAMQKEAVTLELRRRARRRLIKAGAIFVAVALALPVVATFAFNREPGEPALEAHAEKIAAEMLALHSNAAQPLMTAATAVRPLPPVGLGHLRYEVVVTMQLRQALYVIAQTNGTEAYRMLQRSLVEAQQRAAKLRLFRPPAQPPELPQMPTLLRLVHRGGEPVVVTVPFAARRFGWRWRLQPAELGARTVSRALDGLPLESFANRPTLIFGSPESLADVRQRVRLARDYVTAVNKEARDRSVADAPAQESTRREAPGPGPTGVPDPNAPARPEPAERALPDPNVPARSGAKPPAPIDPNAPAVPRPKQSAPPR